MPSMKTVASRIKAWISGNKSGNLTHVIKRLLDAFLTKNHLQVLAQ
jgi:phosphoribosyl-AMP cyclohydrolase